MVAALKHHPVKDALIDRYLAGGAGQRHSPLQLCEYGLLQCVQLVHPSSTSSNSRSVQFVASSVHQVVVDSEQGLIVDLSNKMNSVHLWHTSFCHVYRAASTFYLCGVLLSGQAKENIQFLPLE